MSPGSLPTDRPRRVCVVGAGWRFTSGISYYTCQLTRALDRAGRYEISAILMRRLMPAALYPGRARVGTPVNELAYPDSIDVFDGVDWFWSLSLPRAVRFLRRRRPDVIVFQWWTATVVHTYAALILLARAMGITVVIEVHEFGDSGELRHRGVARYSRALLSWVLRRTDALVVHSDYDRTRVRDGWPQYFGPVHVLPHGPFDQHLAAADPPVDGSTDERADQSADEPADGREAGVTTLLYFGTIRPYKGLEHLIEAFGRLDHDEARALRLLVVGETWEGWTHPLELIERNPNRDRITVVNRYVHDREVNGFFRRADAVVLPYLRSSASGPLHIAMAYGLPVVVTDVGGLRDGAAGYDGIRWVEPSDVDGLVAAIRGLPEVVGERFTDPRSWETSARLFGQIFDETRGAHAATTRGIGR